jgi:hypothetical protein
LWVDISKAWISRRLLKLRSVAGPSEIADKVKMAAILSCDAERLLQQSVGLVAVTVRPFVKTVLIAIAALLTVYAFGPRARRSLISASRLREASSLSLHFAVSQKAAGNAASAP